jgi:3-deoxy-D-manno-octulosonic-acid transferase
MLANLLYVAALAAVSPIVLFRMLRHGRYRRGWQQKLLGLTNTQAQSLRQAAGAQQRCVWVHAVSVGEVNLLPTLVRRLERQSPDCGIVISTSTDTGYDLAVQHFGADRVFFCPLDFTWAVRRTLRNLQCEMLVLTELELWPNLIRLAAQVNCKTVVINARLSEHSAARYQRFSRWTGEIFNQLDWVGCQDEFCCERFAQCGVPQSRTIVTGSMKFDNAPSSRENIEVQLRAQWAGVDPWHRVWVVGSTQAGEESMVLTIYSQLIGEFPDLRLVIVPRHVERFNEVAAEIEQHELKAHRRSSGESLFKSEWSAEQVILVDTIGELRHWWGIAHMATVGGSFGNRGGQNMLEPAGYGAAVSFGPNTKNFAEIAERLLAAGGAVRVQDGTELTMFVRTCLTQPSFMDTLGRAAKTVVKTHQGATDRTVTELLSLLSSRQTKRHTQAA